MLSLVDYRGHYPPLPDGPMFTNVITDNYWTGTSLHGNPGVATWFVDMVTGRSYQVSKGAGAEYVWPVRDGT